MDGPLSCNTFYPTTVKVPGHDSWIHYSRIKPWKKTEEDTQYTCEPLGDLIYLIRTTNECHSNDTPKIKFLGIRFIRATLKSQHSLAGVVLQNRQEIGLLIPEQGGTWSILNEMCCFWKIPSAKFKKSHSPQKKKKKKFKSYRISKNKLESFRGDYNLSLRDPSPGKLEFGVG